jgi:hypothetical protein
MSLDYNKNKDKLILNNMNSIDGLMDMILTENLEANINNTPVSTAIVPVNNPQVQAKSNSALLPIKYNLELIRSPDGSYTWAE